MKRLASLKNVADRLADQVFGALDVLVKKAGHALGYGLLGVAYFYALPPRLSRGYRWVMSLLMALLFALILQVAVKRSIVFWNIKNKA